MMLHHYRRVMPAVVMLLVTAGCEAHAVPFGNGASTQQIFGSRSSGSPASDTTSILKRLTKQVAIGSTVDAKNGDRGPRAISVVPREWRDNTLIKDQLVVCNFENSAGAAGKGTTMEVLDPKPHSKPVRFYQSDLIEGCDGVGISSPKFDAVYGAGYASGKIVAINDKGPPKTFGGDILTKPLSDASADPAQNFSPLFVYAGSTASGGIVSINVGFYGDGRATQVAKGFGVGHGPEGDLGPSGLQYDRNVDTLYIVDGVTNTIVAFSNASRLLEKDEIIVKPDGKSFECKHRSTTCGKVIYSGSPLNAPMASTLLPNGNLIVANTGGTANTLVELTPGGQVLDTKVVGSSSTQGVFGLAARGTDDRNTVLFFTDSNSNTVQELTR